MIALELDRVVVSDPHLDPVSGGMRSLPRELRKGAYDGVRRICYLPSLALVAIDWFGGERSSIVPLEHVWHMDVLGGDALETIAQVIP